MQTRQLLLPGLCCALSAAVAVDGRAQSAAPTPAASYAYATNGVLDNVQRANGVKWKLVVDESNLGGKELEAAEVTLPGGTATPNHMHGPVEVIYVLSGTYDHEVNGKRYRLTPGMVGIVRPGDQVRHLAPDGETKLLILWAPAGEAARVFSSNTAGGTAPPPVPEQK
jgi:quercetin dioxygenase-like cupin family protein